MLNPKYTIVGHELKQLNIELMHYLIDNVMHTNKKIFVIFLTACALGALYYKPIFRSSNDQEKILLSFLNNQQEISLPSSNNQQEISLPSSNILEENFISSWIQYRNNWNGEMLIQSDKRKKQISLPKTYIEAMTEKGPHPLTQKYPKFLERLDYIYEHCPSISTPVNYKLNLNHYQYFFQFNDDYEVLNCLVAKAASTTWLIQLSRMNDPSIPQSTLTRKYVALLHNISLGTHMKNPIKTARRMQTYTKFFVQRHPFERLVSCFISKFEKPKNYQYIMIYAKQIIVSNYLKNYPKTRQAFEKDFKHLPTLRKQEILYQIDRLKSDQYNFNITFTEFVNFITSSLNNEAINRIDIHWRPITRMCNPCAVRYDIVIEHENMAEESQMLLDYLQTNKPTNRRLLIDSVSRLSTRDKCNKYFARLSPSLRQKLYELYRDDFLLFGYECNPGSESNACEGVK